MEAFWQDVRYGVRTLLNSPGFTVLAIATLALGIGANTALFSVVNGVLLEPLHFQEPHRLVTLYEHKLQFVYGSISYPNFLDWKRDNRSFESIAAFRPDDFSFTGAGEPQRLDGMMVSSDLLQILGVKPLLGRDFDPRQDELGGRPEVMISEGLWKSKFSAVPDVVGKPMTLNGTEYTIVGVVPASFHMYMQNFHSGDVYVLIGQWNDVIFRERKIAMGMDAVARLKPGVTLEKARADMDSVTRNLAEVYPEANTNVGATVVSLKEKMVGEIRPYLIVLLAAVFFVLMIACVNVANLLLTRSMSRSREFAIRTALGASKPRVIRQLLTESVLLSLCGGAIGLILAAWGTQAALGLLPKACLAPRRSSLIRECWYSRW